MIEKTIEPQEIDVQAIEPCEIQSIDPLVLMGVGLMLMGGAISTSEAREIAGLEPIGEGERARLQAIVTWSRNTGVMVQPWALEFWPKKVYS